MAKQRIINTRFWDDSYIAGLSPTEKLLFLYLLTNPLTNIAGVYELPSRRAAFDTGISEDAVEKTLRKFERDGKAVINGGWIGIVNFIKYQTLNPKVRQGIAAELKKAPKAVVDRLSIDYRRLGIDYEGLSHLNSNLNINRNSIELPWGQLSTAFPQDIEKRRKELLKKFRL